MIFTQIKNKRAERRMHRGTEGRMEYKILKNKGLVSTPFKVRLELACERKSPGWSEFTSVSVRGNVGSKNKHQNKSRTSCRRFLNRVWVCFFSACRANTACPWQGRSNASAANPDVPRAYDCQRINMLLISNLIDCKHTNLRRGLKKYTQTL